MIVTKKSLSRRTFLRGAGAAVALLMPMRPPTALTGAKPAAGVVAPGARFARRTCCQKMFDSTVPVSATFQAPSMTPLPSVPPVPGVPDAPMWFVTWLSSPGSDLNLSW